MLDFQIYNYLFRTFGIVESVQGHTTRTGVSHVKMAVRWLLKDAPRGIFTN